MPRSARRNVVGVEPKGSKCNLKIECKINMMMYLSKRPRSFTFSFTEQNMQIKITLLKPLSCARRIARYIKNKNKKVAHTIAVNSLSVSICFVLCAGYVIRSTEHPCKGTCTHATKGFPHVTTYFFLLFFYKSHAAKIYTALRDRQNKRQRKGRKKGAWWEKDVANLPSPSLFISGLAAREQLVSGRRT